jgi:hypothetical protein
MDRRDPALRDFDVLATPSDTAQPRAFEAPILRPDEGHMPPWLRGALTQPFHPVIGHTSFALPGASGHTVA